MSLVEVTPKEFRKHQKEYFARADKGEQVVIRRGEKQDYLLTPVILDEDDDDDYYTPEMIQRLKESAQEIKEGKYTVVRTKKELRDFLDSL